MVAGKTGVRTLAWVMSIGIGQPHGLKSSASLLLTQHRMDSYVNLKSFCRFATRRSSLSQPSSEARPLTLRTFTPWFGGWVPTVHKNKPTTDVYGIQVARTHNVKWFVDWPLERSMRKNIITSNNKRDDAGKPVDNMVQRDIASMPLMWSAKVADNVRHGCRQCLGRDFVPTKHLQTLLWSPHYDVH